VVGSAPCNGHVTSGITLDPAEWQIVNDGVMGGMSMSRVVAAPAAECDSKAWFAAIRGRFCFGALRLLAAIVEDRAPVGGFALRVHGDGKHYRLTIFTRSATTNAREPYHYQGKFETTGGEQEIRLRSPRSRPACAVVRLPHAARSAPDRRAGAADLGPPAGPFVIDLRAAGPFDA